MKHSIRRTMLVLGGGVVVQRVCQLIGFVLIGRALGVAGLGVFAQGQALAAALTVLAGAGIGNLTARTIAASPGAARSLIGRALRHRLRLGALLAVVAGGLALGLAERPWFWVLCALQPLPAAFDLKSLLDASGRTRHEVGLETATALGWLAAVLVCTTGGVAQVEVFAAISLASRTGYAAAALGALRRLPRAAARTGGDAPRTEPLVGAAPAPAATTAAPGPVPTLARVWRADVAIGQLAHELVILGDVWLVALAAGDAAAGLYAVAARFAAAALLPSAQLARLLLPHLLHAGTAAAATTLATALRATALMTLPMVAGGIAAADALCRLGGEAFAGAAPALRLLLIAGCLQHVGWQCSNALLASFRDRAYAHGFGWPAVLQLALLAVLGGAAVGEPATAALLAAAAAALAQGAYAAVGLAATRATWRTRTARWWHAVALAGATGLAAAAAAWPAVGAARLPLQLAAGGIAFVGGLWWLELRGRWRRVGDGLAAASGLRT